MERTAEAILKEELAQPKASLAIPQAERALREAEAQVAQLTCKLEAVRAEDRAALAAAKRTCGALEREILYLLAYGAGLERKHAALLSSTSWRVTEPARRLLRLVRRRRAPRAFKPRLAPGGTTADKSLGMTDSLADTAARPRSKAYVNTVSDLLKSSISLAVGGEFVPFDVVKPATRGPATPVGPRFVFAITLASRRSVPDWAHTKRLLGQTLRSVMGQSDPDWTVIIAGHELPHLPELDDDRVEFVRIHRRRPGDKTQFRSDKAAKRHVLGRRLAEMGGGYFMQLDADDLVRDDFVATVRSEGYANGAVSLQGYALDYRNRRLAPVPGVWQRDLTLVCGSCSAVRYLPGDLPDHHHRTNDDGLTFNMTRQHCYTAIAMEELGRPLAVFPEPMVVYLVNHGQNLSFGQQRAGDRGVHVIESIARHSLPPNEARAVLHRFGVLA